MKEMEDAVSEVGASGDHPRGRLRLNLPRLAAEVVLAQRLPQFTSLYPDVMLDLVIEDSLTDIVAGHFDAGIRSREWLQADMVAVPLTSDLQPAVVASPDYFASRGTPLTPRDLISHRCINYRWPQSRSAYRWQFEKDGETFDVTPERPLTINDTSIILRATLDGAGIAYILEDVVAAHIQAGRLIPVLQDWCRPLGGFHLYFPSRRHMSAPLKAFIEFFRYRDAGKVAIEGKRHE
jgi:DNA-binding transcriptional LysR family regulator